VTGRISTWTELPRTDTGKVDQRRIGELASELSAGWCLGHFCAADSLSSTQVNGEGERVSWDRDEDGGSVEIQASNMPGSCSGVVQITPSDS
jgi:hypothetical protein